MSGNEWKDISWNPNYQVSRSGHIRNKATKRILAENVNGSSSRYLRVTIGKKHYIIHRIVADQFIPNPQGFDEVDHINRDKTDNSVSNLRWIDHRSNILSFYICIQMGIVGKTPRRRNRKEQRS